MDTPIQVEVVSIAEDVITIRFFTETIAVVVKIPKREGVTDDRLIEEETKFASAHIEKAESTKPLVEFVINDDVEGVRQWILDDIMYGNIDLWASVKKNPELTYTVDGDEYAILDAEALCKNIHNPGYIPNVTKNGIALAFDSDQKVKDFKLGFERSVRLATFEAVQSQIADMTIEQMVAFVKQQEV
jgi:hypothetical protein